MSANILICRRIASNLADMYKGEAALFLDLVDEYFYDAFLGKTSEEFSEEDIQALLALLDEKLASDEYSDEEITAANKVRSTLTWLLATMSDWEPDERFVEIMVSR